MNLFNGKNLIISCIFFFGDMTVSLVAQSHRIDSLRIRLNTSQTDTDRINTMNELAWSLASAQPDTALDLAENALEISSRISFIKGKGKAYHNLAWIKYLQGNYPEAIDLAQSSISIHRSRNDKRALASTLGNLGVIYDDQGNYPKALETYFNALELAESIGNLSMQSQILGNIGIVYKNLGDLDKALSYYNRALVIKEKLRDTKGTATNLGNIAGIYALKKNYPLALDFFTRALKLKEENGDINGIAINMVNIGNVYFEMAQASADKDSALMRKRNFEIALGYYTDALSKYEQLGSNNGVANTLGSMGILFSYSGDHAKAEQLMLRSIHLADSIGALDISMQVEKEISELYMRIGEYEPALKHYRNFIIARDSLSNEQNTRKQTQVEMQYEFDKKSSADSIRNAEQQKREALKHDNEIKQQRLYTYGGIAGFVLMMIVAMVSFRAFRNKQKANHIISHQKQLVDEKQREILDSIHYAERIQRSLLPPENMIQRNIQRMKG